MSSVIALPAMIVLAIIFCLPILVGVYVYRDAVRRNMSAGLWALAAALVPAFIGLIVYLLVRSEYADLRCPRCAAPVAADFAVCPKCGAKLRACCPHCKTPVEPDWKVCPRCAEELPADQSDVLPPVRAGGSMDWKMLVVVVGVPVLLILLLVFGMKRSFSEGAASYQELSFDEYDRQMQSMALEETAQKVHQWLDEAALKPDRAHALRYDYDNGGGMEHYYLVYVPGGGNSPHTGFGQSSSVFGTTLTLDLVWTGNAGTLFNLVSSSESAPGLKIVLSGEKLDCDVETVDYNPTVYYIVPRYDELEPGAGDIPMPERISVVRIEGNSNTGVAEVSDQDVAFDILAGIDSAPYLELEHPIYGRSDGTGGYDFTDGFEIIIEYRVNEGMLLHPDMLTCLVFEQNESYYLIDDRPDNGRTFRQTDQSFYDMLAALFA